MPLAQSALIVPLRRLPARFSSFAYLVPETMAEEVRAGQLVLAPFQKQDVLGVIVETRQEKIPEAKKEITKIVNTQPLIGAVGLGLFRELCRAFPGAGPQILKLLLPPLAKTKIAKEQLLEFPEVTAKKKPTEIFRYDSPHERLRAIKKIIAAVPDDAQALILLPEKNDLFTDLAAALQSSGVTVFSSEMKASDAYGAWMRVRRGTAHLILGTKIALFLPFIHLHTIIVDLEHNENHKNWDQHPRYDGIEVARLLAEAHDARLVRTSFSLSLQAIHEIQNGQAEKTGPLYPPPLDARIIDMNAERAGKNFSVLSFAAQELGAAEDGQRVLIVTFSRESAAKIAAQMPFQTVALPAAIAWQDWSRIDAVVVADADTLFHVPEYRALEKYFHALQEIRWRLNKEKPILVQTALPDHQFFSALNGNPRAWYAHELSTRKQFGYPPYVELIKIFTDTPEPRASRTEAEEIAKAVMRLNPQAKVSEPTSIRSTRAINGRRLILIVKFPAQDTVRDNGPRERLLAALPKNWYAELNPHTIIS